MFASAKGKQQKSVRQLQCKEQCIDDITYYLSVVEEDTKQISSEEH